LIVGGVVRFDTLVRVWAVSVLGRDLEMSFFTPFFLGWSARPFSYGILFLFCITSSGFDA
jgi:hypothetical protein